MQGLPGVGSDRLFPVLKERSQNAGYGAPRTQELARIVLASRCFDHRTSAAKRENYSEHFPALQSEFKYIADGSGRFRAPRKLNNGYFYESNLSANLIYRLCNETLEHVGARELWRVETRP